MEKLLSRPILIVVCAIIWSILGVISFYRLPLELLPAADLPRITIITSLSGYDPDSMERSITRPVEESVGSIPGVKEVYSATEKSKSTVIVECDSEANINTVVMDIWESLKKNNFPDDTSGPVIYRHNPDSFPVVAIALSSDENQKEKYAEDFKSELERIDGVSMVDIAGQMQQVVRVDCDADKITASGISLALIISRLQAENSRSPSGYIENGKISSYVLADSRVHSLEEIQSIVLKQNRKGGFITIGDIAEVYRDTLPLASISRVNQEESLTLYVIKEDGTNTVDVAGKIMKAAEQFAHENKDVKLVTVYNQAEYIEKAVKRVQSSIMAGMILSALLIAVFFMDLRAPLIVAVSIPLSVIITFLFMYLKGITLNLISLSGLALGVGTLVDNSIIVTEAILKGKTVSEKAHALKSAFMPVFASTLTTIVVFWPLVYIKKELALIYYDLVYTVTVSLLVSLAVSFTVVPVLVSRIRHENTVLSKYLEKTAVFFSGFSLKYAAMVLVFSVVAIAASGSSFFYAEREYMASMEPDTFMLHLEMLPGSGQDKILESVKKAESVLMGASDIKNVLSRTEKTSAEITVKLKDPEQRTSSLADLYSKIRPQLDKIPFTQIYFTASGGADTSNVLKIEVFGPDYTKRIRIARTIQEQLAKDSEFFSDAAIRERAPEKNILVVPDSIKSTVVGFSLKEVAQSIRAAITGPTASYFSDGKKEFPVITRFSRGYVNGLETIGKIPVVKDERKIQVSEICTVKIEQETPKINKKGLQHYTVITANCKKTLSECVRQAQKITDAVKLPESHYIEFGQEVKKMEDSFQQMIFAIGITVLLIYMILASLYESFLRPLLVMVSVPLSYAGVGVYLFLSGSSLNMSVYIGCIILAGIVVNGIIILVDEVFRNTASNMSSETAVTEAVKSRVQPMLLTTATTILGLIPVCIASGEGTALWKTMGLTVVSGIFCAAVFSLVLYPAVIYLYIRAEKKVFS